MYPDKSLTSLVENVGEKQADYVLSNLCGMYPKTESMLKDGEPFTSFECAFDATFDTSMCAFLRDNIDVRSTQWSSDCYAIVHMIGRVREELVLHKCDYFIIQKRHYSVARVKNTLAPRSNRCIVINIDTAKQELQNVLDRRPKYYWIPLTIIALYAATKIKLF